MRLKAQLLYQPGETCGAVSFVELNHLVQCAAAPSTHGGILSSDVFCKFLDNCFSPFCIAEFLADIAADLPQHREGFCVDSFGNPLTVRLDYVINSLKIGNGNVGRQGNVFLHHIKLLSFYKDTLFSLSPGVVDDFHCVGFGLFGDVDVGAHCLVVGVAGPFHYDLGRDALGEGEADEGAAGGVGADEGPLGVGFFDSLAGAVADDGDGVGESAELAEVFEVVVHLLIGDDGEGEAHRELFVLIFFEYRLGVLAEVDREAVVGLLGGDVDFVVGDVGALEGGHIGVAEAGEGAEAEEVAGLGEGAGFLDGLFVFEAVHIGEFDFGAVGGDVVAVEFQEFFSGEGRGGIWLSLILYFTKIRALSDLAPSMSSEALMRLSIRAISSSFSLMRASSCSR